MWWSKECFLLTNTPAPTRTSCTTESYIQTTDATWMTTIPSRLSRIARQSSSPAEARSRAIQLYRDWYRAAPEIVAMYGLPVTPSLIRRRMREEFERNRYIDDVRLIDRLLLKGQQEYQETMNVWKQEPHILGILLQQKQKGPRSFLEKFYQGKDDEGVVPAVFTRSSGL